jgi:hypothetical protein
MKIRNYICAGICLNDMSCSNLKIGADLSQIVGFHVYDNTKSTFNDLYNSVSIHLTRKINAQNN